jgi:hypothetical protein
VRRRNEHFVTKVRTLRKRHRKGGIKRWQQTPASTGSYSAPKKAASQSKKQLEFASIEDAVRDLKAGRMIVVIDDEDRENEGDLAMAADMIAPDAVASWPLMEEA